MPGRPLILGHRGSPTRARENSLDSYRIALDEGADGIELDVQTTGDGVLVAHHDDALPSGEKLAEHSYKELRPLAQNAGFDLPELREAFRVAAGRGLLNIELKRSGYEASAIRLAREMLPRDRFAFSSFDGQAVIHCRVFAPDVPAFLIVWGEREAGHDLRTLRELDASGVAFESSHVTEPLAETFRAARYPVFAWTVNDAQQAKQLAQWGITGIITDIPAELTAALNSRKHG